MKPGTNEKPVDKQAALHIAGGDRRGREELLWAQREAFDRAMVEARIENADSEVSARLLFHRGQSRLATLPEGSTYTHDYRKHVKRNHFRARRVRGVGGRLRSIHTKGLKP